MKKHKDTDISKQWMLDRCASVGVNFLFAGSLGLYWPSWGSGLPSVTARYLSDKQSCIQGQCPPHTSPHRPRQTQANRLLSTMHKPSVENT